MPVTRARTAQVKTAAPAPPDVMIARPRLTERLDELLRIGPPTNLMLVSAPAGFGKTTLLSAWAPSVEATGARLVWCNLDDTDDSCFRFWSSLLAALAASAPGTSTEAADLAAPHRPGNADFLTSFIEVLGETRTVLVLENLHEVSDLGTLGDLGFLLAHQPPGLAIVLSSRFDPPIEAVQRAKLTGRLGQLRAAELAFRPEEVARLCSDLAPRQRLTVWERTEGWPALVRMMGLALEATDADDIDLPVGDTDLADYLFRETFRRQPAEVRRVLLLTSVPALVSRDLAVRLSGASDAGAVLDDVARRSGLITWSSRSGSEDDWWRFHPLLRAYLLGELFRTDRDGAREAERETARFFLDAGLDLSALRHASASGDPVFEEGVVRTAGPGLVNSGDAALLLAALSQQPHRRGHGRAWTILMRAAAMLDGGQVQEASAELLGVSRADESAAREDPGLAVARLATHVHVGRRQGLPFDARVLVARAPVADPDLRLLLAAQRGGALLWQGESASAENELLVGIELARGYGREAALVDCLGFEAGVHLCHSDFSRMMLCADEALDVADGQGWARAGRTAYPHALRAWGAYQSLDDHLARWHSDRAMSRLEPSADPTTRLTVETVRALLADARIDGHEEADALHAAWSLPPELVVMPSWVVAVALADARISLRRRQTHRIPEIVARLEDRVGPCGEVDLVRAMLAVATGRRREARDALADLLGGSRLIAPSSRVEALVMAASLADQDRDDFAATAHARAALALADEQQGLRPLVAGGAAFQDLLRRGTGRWGAQSDLVTRVLAHAPAPPLPSVALTARELEVLRELPNLNTVEDIAAALFVSPNTVKTHLRSVYRKLGVPTRRGAVAEARRLGLL